MTYSFKGLDTSMTHIDYYFLLFSHAQLQMLGAYSLIVVTAAGSFTV